MNDDSPIDNAPPANLVEGIRRSIANRLMYSVGKDLRSATQHDWMFAVFHTVRDRVMSRGDSTHLLAVRGLCESARSCEEL